LSEHAGSLAPGTTPTMWDALRWRIALLLGLGVLVNYFDRVGLSVAVAQLKDEFGLSTVAIGYLLSTYSWTYVVLQLPSGPLLDRFGVKRVGRASAFLWSMASFLTAAAHGLGGLVAARLLLGVAEAPTFPANAKAIATWFPREKRGLPTALFDAAAKFASAIGIPIIAIIVHTWGWRASFVVTGVVSLVYFGLFWMVYRDRGSFSDADANAGRETEESPAPTYKSASLLYLLRRKKVWGLALGMAAYNYNFYLFLTWLPGYLHSALHLDILQSGIYTAIPWLAATASDLLVGGWLVDHLISQGRDATRVRQTILVVGLVMGLAVAGATRTSNPRIAITWISIALCGLAATAPVAWSIPGLIAPRGSVGRVGGIVNCVANVPAVLAPVITGYMVGNTQSFARAFLVAAAILFGGIGSYVFFLGKIEPIPSPA
jgi:MFS transporter, ACS family, D-galactonate transporter